jgi:hypothetical protein
MIIGALHQAGGQQYLYEQSKKNPQAFMTLVGKVLPHTFQVDHKLPSEEELAAMTPLDMLKWTMRACMHAALTDPTKLSLMVDAANKAAAYEHPKLAAIEHKGSISLDDLSLDQLRQLADTLRETGAVYEGDRSPERDGEPGEDQSEVRSKPLRIH